MYINGIISLFILALFNAKYGHKSFSSRIFIIHGIAPFNLFSIKLSSCKIGPSISPNSYPTKRIN